MRVFFKKSFVLITIKSVFLAK